VNEKTNTPSAACIPRHSMEWYSLGLHCVK